MTPKLLRRLRAGQYGRQQALINKLVDEIESLQHLIGDLKGELAAERARGEERDLARADPEHVLIQVEGDGQIEVWCEPYIRVRLLHLPDMRSKAAANAAEELFLRWLPRPYADLRDTYPPKAVGHVRCCPTQKTMVRGLATREVLKHAESLQEAAGQVAPSGAGAA